jgi:hypothetical protein
LYFLKIARKFMKCLWSYNMLKIQFLDFRVQVFVGLKLAHNMLKLDMGQLFYLWFC